MWRFVILIFVIGAWPALAQEPVSDTWSFPEARAFDDWLGEWNVNNRRIGQNGDFQDVGNAYAKVYSVLDGKGILELWDGNLGDLRLYGFSMRYYDKDRGEWVVLLNWPNENAPGFAQMSGKFRHGRIELFAERQRGNIRAVTRYTFSDFAPARLRWDGASSRDNGQTWNTNWIMEFTRAAESATWPIPGEPAHTAGTDSRCNTEAARGLDHLAGLWEGEVDRMMDGEWKTFPASMQGYKVLDGCGVLTKFHFAFPDFPLKIVALYSYFGQTQRWRVAGLDNRPGSGFIIQNGNFKDGALVLTEPEGREGRLRAVWNKVGPDSIEAELSAETAADTWTPTMRLRMTPVEE